VSGQFIAHNSVLLLLQAAVVALPACGVPRWLARAAGRGWALVLPLSIAIVVGAIELFPAVADALTWVAFLLVPPGAALALGWAMHGARPPLAAIAVALFALAWAATGTLIGHSAAAVLTALSTVTLGRLLAGVVPGVWLKAGIVSMAIVDAVLVFGNQLQAPNAVLNAAIPAPGLPQLQYLNLHYASMGYGDVLVAGVLGGVLVCERTRQLPVALLVLVVAALWDLLFLVPSINTLPATVPVAIALILVELRRRLRLTMPAPIRRS
jgi:hypothetical protein